MPNVRVEAHVHVTPALIHGQALDRCAVERLDAGRLCVAAYAMGWPRLWGMAAQAVCRSFRDVNASREAPRGRARLERGLAKAREALVECGDRLIEVRNPDASIIALDLDGMDLHALVAGQGRVYLRRRNRSERLSPRDEREIGLLEAEPAVARVALEPDDVVLAGSTSAFGDEAIAKIVAVLERDPGTPANVLASLLLEPAADAGAGAAAMVLRL